MIINSAPQNEAILSNVGEIGEFRIRNSAKAFNILSSGLYANKIRAVIRELSCNAVDSHAAAGNKETPFDVHLPNTLEPWFAIRDYGTGLSHEQVTNIYTTYFESTKTASNEFIGALGLGSKSPFSYTDNFTVTAIKDGRKGIYTAFINEAGVPSIAKMTEEDTTEPAGVEVKFAVEDRYDFSKFRDEARQVYTYFSLRPVVSGSAEFEFRDAEYESKDIIPGVHSYSDSRRSRAVMGNIAYPVEIPNADTSLGELTHLLNCGLEMHFAIGELDFQASREGLSYIPQTINAIKNKLMALNAVLATKIAEEADKIDNFWERALWMHKKRENGLWSAAVAEYAKKVNIPTYHADNNRYNDLAKFSFEVADLAANYNMVIKGFQRNRGSNVCTNLKSEREYSDTRNAAGHYDSKEVWVFRVEGESNFVINDTKVGALERAKHHYRNQNQQGVYSRNVYVLEPVDRTKPVKTSEFFAALHTPPADRIFNASTLLEKERAQSGVAKNVTIMRLEERGGRGYYRSQEYVWRDAGKSDDFDDNATYYYVPLSGFQMISSKGYTSGKELHNDVTSMPGLFSGTIYGVRKSDIEVIMTKKNWINFEDHIEGKLKANDTKLMMGLVLKFLDNNDILKYNNKSVVTAITHPDSPYAKFVNAFADASEYNGNVNSLNSLYRKFLPNANTSPDALVAKYQGELNSVNRRYPLLAKLSTYRVEAGDIAEYINLIDTSKGI